MLSDVDSLLDELVEIFGDLRSQAVFLQDSQDLISSDTLDLRNTIVVSEDDTNLRGSSSLLGQLDDLFDQFIS